MKMGTREFLALLGLIALVGIILLPALSRVREAARRASCQNNLKQMGIVVKMYANESRGGTYPPLSPIYGNWMMDMNAVYPEYLTDLGVLVCPSSPLAAPTDFRLRSTFRHPRAKVGDYHPDCVTGKYYNYTGFSINGDEPALALYTAYHLNPAAVRGMMELKVPIPRWENSRWNSFAGGYPVMWDRIPVEPSLMPHIPQVINVLCMDGAVKAVRYSPLNHSENFPVTEVAAWTFGMDVPRLDSDCY